ncbi:flagellar basal body-associated FliL family protein [Pelotomaculum propionicicum]|uniref:flagellar basal body-associated FliL family protein n=1 Tax=Pelotomaculum propionicicum TaxID=258475 RepID=UPI003B77F78E
MPKANLSADDGEKAGAKTKPKKKKTWLIIMVVLIILAGSAGGAYWYFHKPAGEAGEAKKKVAAGESESLDMGEVVVNLSGSGGSHYLRVKIVIEYPKDKKLAEELKKKKHTVSDAIITTLRSKTYTEVSAANSAQALKLSIMEEVNNNLDSGEITGVYFTDFLVQ